MEALGEVHGSESQGVWEGLVSGVSAQARLLPWLLWLFAQGRPRETPPSSRRGAGRGRAAHRYLGLPHVPGSQGFGFTHAPQGRRSGCWLDGRVTERMASRGEVQGNGRPLSAVRKTDGVRSSQPILVFF